MTTRPKVHRAELERAITMIAARRSKIEDPNREALPDSPDADPREVLDYLRKYSRPDMPRWVLRADVCDALTLNNWLWWEDRRRELHFLKAGRDRGIFLAQLGAQVGVGKQGVLDRIDRLEALLRYDRPDEKITRAARQARQQARERQAAEQAWLDAHRDELIEVMSGLVDHASRYPIEDAQREWIDELALDARDGQLTPATMVILGLATAELRTAPAVLALEGTRPCTVHTLLARADRLRSQFAALGAQAEPVRDLRPLPPGEFFNVPTSSQTPPRAAPGRHMTATATAALRSNVSGAADPFVSFAGRLSWPGEGPAH